MRIWDMSVVESEPVHRDPEWLRQKHIVEGLSQTEMAELAGVSQPAVHQQLKKHGIETKIGLCNEEVLDDLRRVADALGRTPDTGDYKKHGEYSHSTLIERFGTWRGALRAAGVL